MVSASPHAHGRSCLGSTAASETTWGVLGKVLVGVCRCDSETLKGVMSRYFRIFKKLKSVFASIEFQK